MSTAETVKAQLNALLNQANNTTGKTDTNLTAAIASLVAGFGQGSSGGGLAYDMGEFVLDADIIWNITNGVKHNLGDTPEFILVWTDDFAGLSKDNVSSQQCNIGYIWLSAFTGLKQRLSSSVTGDGFTINCIVYKNDYRLAPMAPSSEAYLTQKPTDTVFYLNKISSSNYWRSGVTYKYFVSKALWNIGGVERAE